MPPIGRRSRDHGVPFDMFGVEFSHQGDGCTFETLCAVFGIREPAISRIAAIVHDLDLKDERFGAPEAATVGAMIEGLQLAYADDDALLAQGMTLFDSLYRSFEQAARSAGPRPLARPKKPARPGRKVTAEEECTVRRSTMAMQPAAAGRANASTRLSARNASRPPGARGVDTPLCGGVRRVLQLRDLPHTAPSAVRPRAGAGPSLVGLVMGASTLTGIFVKLPAGALSDLLGRRRLLLAGALVFATMPFTYLAVSTMALLILLRFLHGSATAIFGPVASASLSDVAPPASRGTWLSMYSTAQGAGQALGPVFAGYLIAAGRFDLAFVTAGVIGLGVPLIVAGWRAAPATTSNRAHGTSSSAASWKSDAIASCS